MTDIDRRFAITDDKGRRRYPNRINGKLRVGKENLVKGGEEADILTFVRAVLVRGRPGRFICADGTMQGTMTFTHRSRAARSYELDPVLARIVGVAVAGKCR